MKQRLPKHPLRLVAFRRHFISLPFLIIISQLVSIFSNRTGMSKPPTGESQGPNLTLNDESIERLFSESGKKQLFFKLLRVRLIYEAQTIRRYFKDNGLDLPLETEALFSDQGLDKRLEEFYSVYKKRILKKLNPQKYLALQRIIHDENWQFFISWETDLIEELKPTCEAPTPSNIELFKLRKKIST